MPERVIFSPGFTSLIGSILIKGTADAGSIQMVTITAQNIIALTYFFAMTVNGTVDIRIYWLIGASIQ